MTILPVPNWYTFIRYLQFNLLVAHIKNLPHNLGTSCTSQWLTQQAKFLNEWFNCTPCQNFIWITQYLAKPWVDVNLSTKAAITCISKSRNYEPEIGKDIVALDYGTKLWKSHKGSWFLPLVIHCWINDSSVNMKPVKARHQWSILSFTEASKTDRILLRIAKKWHLLPREVFTELL